MRTQSIPDRYRAGRLEAKSGHSLALKIWMAQNMVFRMLYHFTKQLFLTLTVVKYIYSSKLGRHMISPPQINSQDQWFGTPETVKYPGSSQLFVKVDEYITHQLRFEMINNTEHMCSWNCTLNRALCEGGRVHYPPTEVWGDQQSVRAAALRQLPAVCHDNIRKGWGQSGLIVTPAVKSITKRVITTSAKDQHD